MVARLLRAVGAFFSAYIAVTIFSMILHRAFVGEPATDTMSVMIVFVVVPAAFAIMVSVAVFSRTGLGVLPTCTHCGSIIAFAARRHGDLRFCGVSCETQAGFSAAGTSGVAQMRVTGKRLCLLSTAPVLVWVLAGAAEALLGVAVPGCQILKRVAISCGRASSLIVLFDAVDLVAGILIFIITAPGLLIGALLWLLGMWRGRGAADT